LERTFFAWINQSAALVVDMQGVVRVAVVTNVSLTWLSPQRMHMITDVLDKLNPEA